MSILRAGAFEPAVRFDRPLIERMRRFPRERGAVQRGIQTIAASSIRAWLRLYHRFEIVGRENLPAAGSFVMVANHGSHLDALCVLSALPLARLPRAFPAAARDYFFESLPRLALSVFVLNALPFDRTAHVRESLDRCRDLLSRPGNILILFPEGTRSTCDQIGPFRPGIGRLLADSKCQLSPVTCPARTGHCPRAPGSRGRAKFGSRSAHHLPSPGSGGIGIRFGFCVSNSGKRS